MGIGCYYDTGYTTRQVLLSLPSAIANYFTANVDVVIMAISNRLSVTRCFFFSEWVAGLAPYPIDLIYLLQVVAAILVLIIMTTTFRGLLNTFVTSQQSPSH